VSWGDLGNWGTRGTRAKRELPVNDLIPPETCQVVSCAVAHAFLAVYFIELFHDLTGVSLVSEEVNRGS